MTTALLIVYKGDYGIPISWTLYASNGTTPFDLTGYTVKFKVWAAGNPSQLLVNGLCSITGSPVNGTVTYTPVSTDFVETGQFMAEFEADKSGAIVSFHQFILTVKESP